VRILADRDMTPAVQEPTPPDPLPSVDEAKSARALYQKVLAA
jgi:hypothetical protein